MILKEIQPCTIDPVFEIKEYKCSFGWQVMIIGLSGVQLSLLLYKWVVKLDKQEVRIQLVIRVLLKTIENKDETKSCYQLIKTMAKF